MAVELVSSSPATTEAPSTTLPQDKGKNFSSQKKGIKGLEKQRLRAAGKSFESPEELSAHILSLILAGPKTPGEILDKIGGSAERVRLYCKELEREGKIEKDGAHWKKKNATGEEIKARRLDMLTEDDFFALEIMQPFVKNARRPDLISENPESDLKHFRNMCIGKTVKSFKCHPDDWIFPDTIHAFRDAYYAERKTNRISGGTRQALRYFVELCMKHKLSESESAMLGIDGSKDNAGAYADCMMSDQEFETLIRFFQKQGDALNANVIAYFYAEAEKLKGAEEKDTKALRKKYIRWARYIEKHPTTSREAAADVAFGVETFFRPETKFDANPRNFKVIKSVLVRAKTDWDQDWTIDEGRVRDLQMFKAMNPHVADKITIERLDIETIEGRGFETKTGVEYPKEIRNPLAVSVVKEWLAERQAEHREEMFGNKGESFKVYQKRMVPILQFGYKMIGLTHEYFFMRPLYALRHCGAHLWLRRTNYNYNAVASMGWEDINTLRQFYGKYDHRERKKTYVRAW